jgi:hypothetical protein
MRHGRRTRPISDPTANAAIARVEPAPVRARLDDVPLELLNRVDVVDSPAEPRQEPELAPVDVERLLDFLCRHGRPSYRSARTFNAIRLGADPAAYSFGVADHLAKHPEATDAQLAEAGEIAIQRDGGTERQRSKCVDCGRRCDVGAITSWLRAVPLCQTCRARHQESGTMPEYDFSDAEYQSADGSREYFFVVPEMGEIHDRVVYLVNADILSPMQKEVIRLRYQIGLSAEQAAGVLNVKRQTVQEHEARAIKRLLRILEPEPMLEQDAA